MANTIHRIPRRNDRASAAAAALLCCATIACRTPSASSTSGPVSAPPAAEAKQTRPAATAVEAQPRAVVMPSGKAYLVLRSGPEQRVDTLTWEVLYLAGHDASEPARPDAQEGLAAVARDLLRAFSPIAELAQVGRLSAGSRRARARTCHRARRRRAARRARACVLGGEREGIDVHGPVAVGSTRRRARCGERRRPASALGQRHVGR
jgi:hypothetical protein